MPKSVSSLRLPYNFLHAATSRAFQNTHFIPVEPEAAIKAWIEDGALAGSKDALDQASYLRQTQDFYGRFQSYELITTRILTPRTRVLYFLGPLFAKFVIYRVPQRWLLTSFDFNIREEMILPIGFTQEPPTAR